LPKARVAPNFEGRDLPMPSLPVYIKLDRLICHREGSGWRRTEPYLWTIFFAIDGQHIRLTEQFRLEGEAQFHFTPGSHGNLGVHAVTSGQVIRIPQAIGSWETELHPIKVPFFNYNIPGMVGVVTVLMEEENVSAQGAEAGHDALNRYVRQAVNQSIKDFDVRDIDVENIQASIKAYFAGKVSSFVDGIEVAVSGAVRSAQNLIQNLWSLLDRDELIGYEIWDYNSVELGKAPGPIKFSRRWEVGANGDWELFGQVWVGKKDGPTGEVEVEIE
jgi:hypothetical protein